MARIINFIRLHQKFECVIISFFCKIFRSDILVRYPKSLHTLNLINTSYIDFYKAVFKVWMHSDLLFSVKVWNRNKTWIFFNVRGNTFYTKNSHCTVHRHCKDTLKAHYSRFSKNIKKFHEILMHAIYCNVMYRLCIIWYLCNTHYSMLLYVICHI